MLHARLQQKFESEVLCSRSRTNLTASSAWAMLYTMPYPVVEAVWHCHELENGVAAAKQQCAAEQRGHDK